MRKPPPPPNQAAKPPGGTAWKHSRLDLEPANEQVRGRGGVGGKELHVLRCGGPGSASIGRVRRLCCTWVPLGQLYLSCVSDRGARCCFPLTAHCIDHSTAAGGRRAAGEGELGSVQHWRTLPMPVPRSLGSANISPAGFFGSVSGSPQFLEVKISATAVYQGGSLAAPQRRRWLFACAFLASLPVWPWGPPVTVRPGTASPGFP